VRHATRDIERGSDSAWASVLAAMAALAVAMGIGRFAFTPILPMMQEDFGLSVSEGGWLATANYIGYLAGAISAIGMRIRPAVAIRVGLLVIGVSTLAMGLEHGFALWVVLRATAGIASAWVLVFVSAWALERLALLGRPGLSGALYSGVGAGMLAAGCACLVAMSLHARSTDAWLSLGAISIAITAAVWPLVKASPSSEGQPSPVTTAPSDVRSATFRRLVLCYGAFGFGYIIPATFLPAMAKQMVEDPRLFGWAWPVFGAAAAVSTIFASRLNQAVSHRAIWVGGHLIMAIGILVPVVVAGLPGIMAAALLVGGTFMVITMAGMEEARRVAGAHARALMAAMTSAFALGQILGPVIVSLLVQSTGGFAPALVLAASTLVLSVFLLQRREAVYE
jgi:predicted MFS family arabinose efflux permease